MLHLSLHGVHKLSSGVQKELIWQIRRQFEPLVNEAGKKLKLTVGGSQGELNINFDSDTTHHEVCGGGVLGEGAAGDVDVNAHRNLRVCGPVDPHTGIRDTRHILGSSRYLARALANSALHELGHFVANLEDCRDLTNYMTTIGPNTSQRTMKSMRDWLAGPQSFTSDQHGKMVTQLRKAEWLGDFRVQ